MVYEIDVDTDNALGTFVTPYKTVLADDLSDSVDANIVTVDSTIGCERKMVVLEFKTKLYHILIKLSINF